MQNDIVLSTFLKQIYLITDIIDGKYVMSKTFLIYLKVFYNSLSIIYLVIHNIIFLGWFF